MDIVKNTVAETISFSQPGIRSSLGMTSLQINLRSSSRGEPFRKMYTREELKALGSNGQDGGIPTPFTNALGPVTIENSAYTLEVKPKVVGTHTEVREPRILSSFQLPVKYQPWNDKVLNIEHRSRKLPGMYPLPEQTHPGRTGVFYNPTADPKKLFPGLFNSTPPTQQEPVRVGQPVVAPPPGSTKPGGSLPGGSLPTGSLPGGGTCMSY